MDAIVNGIEHAISAAESFIPSPVPVPGIVTTAAKTLSEKATSPSFPYRINHTDLGDVVLWQAIIVIFLQPCLWNVIGRFEYYTRVFSKLFFKPLYGVYALALWIFVAGLYRDMLFVAAMDRQETVESLAAPEYRALAFAFTAVGVVLVLSSFYQLGVTGTYLGDYFGILMEKRVTGFPFSYFTDPMYDGSTMIFLGKAIFAKSPAGMLMAGWVYIVYRIACLFEGPFTAKIYANRSTEKKKN